MLGSISNVTSAPPLLYPSKASNSLLIQNTPFEENIKDYASTWKRPVRVATTENIVLFGLQTIDSVQLLTGDRVLVKDQVSNLGKDLVYGDGIYVVSGDLWQRADDCAYGTSSDGLVVYILEGTINGKKLFYSTTQEGFVGQTDITFSAISADNSNLIIPSSIVYNRTGALYTNYNFQISGSSLIINNFFASNNTFSLIGNVDSTFANMVLKPLNNNSSAAGNDLNVSSSGSISYTAGSSNTLSSNIFINCDHDLNVNSARDLIFNSGSGTQKGPVNINGTVSITNGLTTQISSTITLPKSNSTVSGGIASITTAQGTINVHSDIATLSKITADIVSSGSPTIDSDSVILVNVQSYGGSGKPTVYVSNINSGSNQFTVTIYNASTSNAISSLDLLVFGYLIL
jgi:hypothetical protein